MLFHQILTATRARMEQLEQELRQAKGRTVVTLVGGGNAVA
jgi:hypothetical protein